MIRNVESYLADIRDLDPIGWWPPAVGWWLAAMAGIALAGLLWWWIRTPFRFGSWRWDARRRLRSLSRRLRGQPVKQSAQELSELLRRIAIARCGRPACAGLTGRAWLQWLSEHDPKGFDWVEAGQILIRLPYAPEDPNVGTSHLRRLVRAAEAWIVAEPGACARPAVGAAKTGEDVPEAA